MIKYLSSIVSKGLTKFIVLSRPTRDIQESLVTSTGRPDTNIRHIIMQHENKADIEKIVDSGMHVINQALSKASPAMPQGTLEDVFYSLRARERVTLRRIRNYLLENANGVVLWVTLALKTLGNHCRAPGTTATELEELLRVLPRDLLELYTYLANQLRSQLSDERLKKARDILMWVSGASIVRALTLEELWEGLALPQPHQVAMASDDDFRVTNGIWMGEWEHFCSILLGLCSFFVEVIDPKSGKLGPASKLYRGTQEPVTGHHVVQLVHLTAKDFFSDPKLAGVLSFTEADASLFVTTSGQLYTSIVCQRFRRQFEAQRSKRSSPDAKPSEIAHWVTNYLQDKVLFGFFLRKGLYSTLGHPDVWDLQGRISNYPVVDWEASLTYYIFEAACQAGSVRNMHNLIEISSLDETWWQRNRTTVLNSAIITAANMLEAPFVRRLMGAWHEQISPEIRIALAPITMKANVENYNGMPGPSDDDPDCIELHLAIGSEEGLRKLQEVRDRRTPRQIWIRNMRLKEERQAGVKRGGEGHAGTWFAKPLRPTSNENRNDVRRCIEILASHHSGRGKLSEDGYTSMYRHA